MPSQALVLLTTKSSIFIQFITGILGFYGLSVDVPKEANILKEILTLEMIVQVVEFLFYIVLVYIAHVQTMTIFRYGDWFLSTPTMLFTMASYFKYRSAAPPKDVEEVWNSNRIPLIAIFVANFGMLLFGILGELGLLSRWDAFVYGTLCFGVSFGLLYSYFAKDSHMKPLFFIITAIWSMYGVAFLQSIHTKNIAYNGLDILAKNFFGVYLAYILWNTYSEKQKEEASSPQPA